VFRFATRVIVDSIEDVLEKAGLTVDDVALFVPHQANVRIIEAAAKKLKVAADKFYVNVEMTGNTSAASIPIALCEAVEKGMLKPNDNVVFVGFGGGLTWAASVAKWDVTPPEITRVDQQLRRVRFILARVRSRLRRIGRWFTGLGRSPTPEARLRDARKK
jgi:3-oxoacyl-[acyl-carrier-protein] synthase-3